ncbi:hypothetical protein pipiens_011894 [Culex pipiens pipiens]|uniref:Uncharacterized protein n=1 Tax=Culex pipiens pipiens TaxID=38569 RepID=A0ABD1D4H1_CULPP
MPIKATCTGRLVIATDVHVVMCQECKHWIHFSCAQVDMSVTGRNFVCVLCNLDDTKSTSAISVCTTTSSTKARAALQLRRLEEEKEIQERLLKERHEMNKRLQDKANQEEREREFQVLQEKARLESDFLDKKYAVLEEGASISGGKSVRSGRTGISNRSLPSSVGQWLANQTQEEGAVGGINTVTSTSSNGTVPKLPTSKATADALTNVTAVPRIPSYEFPPTTAETKQPCNRKTIGRQHSCQGTCSCAGCGCHSGCIVEPTTPACSCAVHGCHSGGIVKPSTPACSCAVRGCHSGCIVEPTTPACSCAVRGCHSGCIVEPPTSACSCTVRGCHSGCIVEPPTPACSCAVRGCHSGCIVEPPTSACSCAVRGCHSGCIVEPPTPACSCAVRGCHSGCIVEPTIPACFCAIRGCHSGGIVEPPAPACSCAPTSIPTAEMKVTINPPKRAPRLGTTLSLIRGLA